MYEVVGANFQFFVALVVHTLQNFLRSSKDIKAGPRVIWEIDLGGIVSDVKGTSIAVQVNIPK